MKITKRNVKPIETDTIERDIANAGCYLCPCCGERKSSKEYLKEEINDKGLIKLSPVIKPKSIFLDNLYKIDRYMCKTCGAEWESEPYSFKE